MRFFEIVRLVWLNIVENKFKMMLTSLGVIVGAATIMLVLAIGKGSQAQVEEEFKNLNAGAIEVQEGNAFSMQAMMPGQGGFPGAGGAMPNFPGGGGGAGGSGGGEPSGGSGGGNNASRTARAGNMRNLMNNARLTVGDVQDIQALVPGLTDVTLLQNNEQEVFGGVLEETKQVQLVGVYPEYQNVSNLTVQYGSFFIGESDPEYCVVMGYALAEDIFEFAGYAVGDYLEIDSKTYQIIGVLESMGAVASGINPDQAVYMP